MLGYFCPWTYLFFPRAALSENCSLPETDNVRGQISEHSFGPNGGQVNFIIFHTFVYDFFPPKASIQPNLQTICV